ncbi:hypothetical protein HYX13_03500 [Candidatus Woesearchaeota archaeon]|nr:hypothetical protein [Candidatus Woesearchaeota archaeon]
MPRSSAAIGIFTFQKKKKPAPTDMPDFVWLASGRQRFKGGVLMAKKKWEKSHLNQFVDTAGHISRVSS